MIAVQHNLMGVNAYRQLQFTTKIIAEAREGLSSEQRRNDSFDAAAKLALPDEKSRQIWGRNQSVREQEDAISICQVSAGALNQVDSILMQMREISARAAEDEFSGEDRQAAGDEFAMLKKKIDQIGYDTEFNGVSLLRGRDVEVGAEGTAFGDVGFDQVELRPVDMGPVRSRSQAGASVDSLSFAVQTKPETNVGGVNWNLMQGRESAPSSAIKITVPHEKDGRESSVHMVKFKDVAQKNFHYDASTGSWVRMLSCNVGGASLGIRQIVVIEAKTGKEQYYSLTYEIQNTGSADIRYDLMHDGNASYNNEECGTFFADNGMGGRQLPAGNTAEAADVPDSFSICNPDKVLGFTQKIQMDAKDKPDALFIGRQAADDGLKGDSAYGMVWSGRVLKAGETHSHSFRQGIAETASDSNVAGVDMTPNTDRAVRHDRENVILTRQGSDAEEGPRLAVEELNSEALGIGNSSCHTASAARRAIDDVEQAVETVNVMRSKMDSQESRLKDSVMRQGSRVEAGLPEDADRARKMVEDSMSNILKMAEQGMFAQEGTRQNALALLQ